VKCAIRLLLLCHDRRAVAIYTVLAAYRLAVSLPNMMLVSAMSTNDLFQSAPLGEQIKGGKKRGSKEDLHMSLKLTAETPISWSAHENA
jgi:hypothetical protein